MNVLVTGATGFIGSHLCRRLVAGGHRVRAVSLPGESRARLPDVASCIEWVEGDLFHMEKPSLQRLGKGQELVIHCAWYAVPGKYLVARENLDALAGSLRLFEAVWELGAARIVGVGTCFEYEQGPKPLSESTTVGPATLYGAAKLSTFLCARELARQMKRSFAWARLFYLYGPYEADARLVPDLARQLLAGQRVAVTAGTQIRDYLHVEDVAAALLAIGRSPAEGAFNIGSGHPVPVRQLIERVAANTGGAHLVDYGARASNLQDPPYVVANNTRLLRETDWKPAYDLESGLRQTLAWWRKRLGT